jgi:single-stranded-DNA-specific exonuclease
MRWIDAPHAESTTGFPDLNPLIGQILNGRGLSTPGEIKAFLNPNSYLPTAGMAIPSMDKGVERIDSAIKRKESICVWGDFDADGQTATTVLVQTLIAIGADVTYHIPLRATESHGVNLPNLKKIIDQGTKLVITCDTGITANDAVEYARSRGVDFIITDHHDLPEVLPKAVAAIDPKLLPEGHPLGTLAGVGVAFKLSEELINLFRPELLPQDLLDLVALGMVADLAILKNDARFLVQKGIDQLRKTRRLGLTTMMEISELTQTHLTEEHIGFVLGPRLNALGRLGDANPAVDLLTTSDPVRARVLATQLEGLNVQRKLSCDQVYRAAIAQLQENPSLLEAPVIILAHPSWPGGVVGIAASRIVERHGKPAILFSSPPDEPARGSARSVEGLNITKAISAQKDILLGFGGHPMAAGLSLELEKLSEFRRRLSKTVETMLGENPLEERTLFIESWVKLGEANLELSEELEGLAPFGPGNAKPILAAHNIKVIDKNEIGKNHEHLKVVVRDENDVLHELLWWGGAEEIIPEGRIDLAFTLRASDWKGMRRAQLEWVDIQSLEEKPIVLQASKPGLVDYRSSGNQLSLLKELPAGKVIWAENVDKKQLGGVDRNNLNETQSLVIWTTPPSIQVLKRALEATRPAKIYVFGIDPGTDDVNGFLKRLAGLIKYTIAHKGGKTSISELAAATALNDKIIQKGLHWLNQQEQIHVDYFESDQLTVSLYNGGSLTSETEKTLQEIKQLLDEIIAYRNHFSRAEIETLIP